MCEKCHHVQHISWKKKVHGHAFESLKPGKRVEVKQQAGLDPVRDYTTNAQCLRCHTTGYGKPGGFVSLDQTPHLTDVQCEACHGPGSDYVEQVMRRKFSFAHAEVDDQGHIGYVAHTHAHTGAKTPPETMHGHTHTPEPVQETHGHHQGHDRHDHSAQRDQDQEEQDELRKYGYTDLGDPPPNAHRHQGKVFPLDPESASYCMDACHNDTSPTYAVSGIKNFRETFKQQVRKGVHRRYGLMFIHW